MQVELEYKFSKSGESIPLIVDISNPIYDNDSIGYYEYWGSVCYDDKSDYICDFDIDCASALTANDKEVFIRSKFFDGIRESILANEYLMESINDSYSCW